MPVYLNKDRPLNHATGVRKRALEKAEKYESYRRAFRDWAKQSVNVNTGQFFTEQEIADAEQTLTDLVDFWRKRAEAGEQASDLPI